MGKQDIREVVSLVCFVNATSMAVVAGEIHSPTIAIYALSLVFLSALSKALRMYYPDHSKID